MRKKVLVGALGVGLITPFVFPDQAFGGVPLPFATEITQLANYIQLIQQLVTQVQMAQSVFSNLQFVIQNSKNLLQHPFTTISSDLNSLSNVISQSQGLAYGLGALDQQFGKMYPNYTPGRLSDYGNAYVNWSQNTMHSISGHLAAVGLHGTELGTEQQMMNQLHVMLTQPHGQEQAIDLGNHISFEMVNQLQKLRQLMMSDMQAKAAFMGMQVQQQNAQQQAGQTALPNVTWQADQRAW